MFLKMEFEIFYQEVFIDQINFIMYIIQELTIMNRLF